MQKQPKPQKIDWGITIFPLAAIVILSLYLVFFPAQAEAAIASLRNLLVNDLGVVYMVFGLGVLLLSFGIAASKYGNIRLGNLEKPRYSTFTWGSMIFTSTMAADILYWSLCEWSYYYSETPFAMEGMTLAQKQDWSSAYPLFHWGPIPWAFYILPAAAYGYMMHVRKSPRQRMSEACRPVLGKKVDGPLGKIIDLFAIVGLLAATATTFSTATPLLSAALAEVTGLPESNYLSIIVLVFVAVVFTLAVWFGMKGISKLSNICIGLFFGLMAIFLVCGPAKYIIETGVTAIGTVLNNFLSMSTWMDPLRLSGDGVSGFPQNWTIFYWAYWISWSVATPFFIGKISEGRTIRQTIVGAYISGVSATFLSFIVLQLRPSFAGDGGGGHRRADRGRGACRRDPDRFRVAADSGNRDGGADSGDGRLLRLHIRRADDGHRLLFGQEYRPGRGTGQKAADFLERRLYRAADCAAL